jgi:prepilin-type N-terminal cleavage/methylation domain-containing protein
MPLLQDTKYQTRNTKAGFTLIELMIAIVIVAVLATIGAVTYSTAQRSARVSKRVQDLKSIQTALELYKTANGFYPLQTAVNTCVDSSAMQTALVPNYMPAIPTDPSQNGTTNCYIYQSNGSAAAPLAPATEYKIKTNGNLQTTGEMTSNDFAQQNNMIDPQQDGSPGDCLISVSGATPGPSGLGGGIKSWALYSGSNACKF